MQKIYINKIIKKFNFEVINISKDIDNIFTQTPNINRLGIELSGYTMYEKLWDIAYLGKKELQYLLTFPIDMIEKKLISIFKMEPPLIILSPCFKEEYEILNIFKKQTNLNIVISKQTLKEFNLELIELILQEISESKTIHGSLCNVFGVGVLLIGESGIGKSETIIELIKRGHIFVADDSVNIKKINNILIGSALPINKDFIEIRGLGILNFSRTFGFEKIINNTKINVIIELIKQEDKKIKFERFGNNEKKYNILGIDLMHFQIPVERGKNISDLIETAIIKYKLLKNNIDSTQLFLDNINERKKNK